MYFPGTMVHDANTAHLCLKHEDSDVVRLPGMIVRVCYGARPWNRGKVPKCSKVVLHVTCMRTTCGCKDVLFWQCRPSVQDQKGTKSLVVVLPDDASLSICPRFDVDCHYMSDSDIERQAAQ